MTSPLTEEIGPVLVPDESRPFTEHLEELRRRLLRCFLWVGLGTAIGWKWAGALLEFLIRPVGQVVYLSPAEPFAVYFKAAFISGFFLAFPLLAWELWGFLKPAFRRNHPGPLVLFVVVSTALFAAGAWFGWVGLLPAALALLQSFGGVSMTPMITVGHYVSFAAWIVLGCGLIFQLPLGVVVASRAGWVRPAALVRQWRLAAVFILAGAAVLTPTPDVFTQLLLAAPLALLYGVSIGLSFLVTR